VRVTRIRCIETDDLAAACEAQLRAARALDPLAPIHIVARSPLVGTLLRAQLYDRADLLGVDVMTPAELAWRVGCARVLASGSAPIEEGVDLAIVLSVAEDLRGSGELPPYLEAALAMTGFAPACLRTIDDLAGADVGPEQLEGLAPRAADPARIGLLAHIASRYAERLEAAHLIARAPLYGEAANALPARDLGTVIVCGPSDGSSAEAQFLRELAEHHPTVILLPAGLGRVAPRLAGRHTHRFSAATAAPARGGGTSLARLQTRLFAVEAAQPERLDGTVQVLSAAGEALEATEIVRLVRDACAGGVAYRDIAILLRNAAAYAAPLAAAFERAGIDAYFLEGVPRVDPAARALGLLLGLIDADLDRGQVMEFLTTAQIPWETIIGEEDEISPARWDLLSTRAGIVSGLASWRARLAAARGAREELEFEEDRDLRLYDSLLRVVELLAADLASFPTVGTWGELLATTTRLLERWIKSPRLIRERLERLLLPLDRHAPRPTRARFLARVGEIIASQTYREGELEDGRVFVGSIAAAAGLRFGLVFVPGLSERSFPAVVRPDPLLLDAERRALSPELLTTEDGVEAERLLFASAVGAARDRLVLSYARVDGETGRERVPSSFLLAAVEAAVGARIGAEELARLASAGETALGRPHPVVADRALDLVERDLALVASGQAGVAHHLLARAPWLARSVAAERATWEPTLTPYDGIVDAAACAVGLVRLGLNGRTSSVSAIQTLASCPYRYLLHYGLKLRPWEEPARAYQLDDLQAGTVYHEVVHVLFEELIAEGALPITADSLPSAKERARRILEATLATRAEAGTVVHAALLGPTATRLAADLEELLEREVSAGGDGFVPRALEVDFDGLAVSFDGGRTVSLRGAIDRIDVDAAKGRVRVIDYKTGRYNWRDGEELKGGRVVQLPMYNRVAAELHPDKTVEAAIYYHATDRGRFRKKRCEATPEGDVLLRRIFGTLDDLAAQGVFPPVADDCEYCAYDELCGHDREVRAQRKASDPRLAAFRQMRQIP
jgi:ATP-dependent helicase/nuclease subunit B